MIVRIKIWEIKNGVIKKRRVDITDESQYKDFKEIINIYRTENTVVIKVISDVNIVFNGENFGVVFFMPVNIFGYKTHDNERIIGNTSRNPRAKLKVFSDKVIQEALRSYIQKEGD